MSFSFMRALLFDFFLHISRGSRGYIKHFQKNRKFQIQYTRLIDVWPKRSMKFWSANGLWLWNKIYIYIFIFGRFTAFRSGLNKKLLYHWIISFIVSMSYTILFMYIFYVLLHLKATNLNTWNLIAIIILRCTRQIKLQLIITEH